MVDGMGPGFREAALCSAEWSHRLRLDGLELGRRGSAYLRNRSDTWADGLLYLAGLFVVLGLTVASSERRP